MKIAIINELWEEHCTVVEDLLYEAQDDFRKIKPDSVNIFYGILQEQTRSFLNKVKQVLENPDLA